MFDKHQNRNLIIAYVPVLHEGYVKLFRKYPDHDICIWGDDVIGEFPHLRKDIRRISPLLMRQALAEICSQKVWIMWADFRERLKAEAAEHPLHLVFPDDDISAELYEKHFRSYDASLAVFESIFLRWDVKATTKESAVEADRNVSSEALDRELMQQAALESCKSADWWRQVGALIVRGSDVCLVSHNTHVPLEMGSYCDGDPRGNFHKGTKIELSTALHAEAGLIAEAARRGIALEGASLYVTTFPCPPCAKLIAYSGIKKCFYASGYAMLDGEGILRSQSVEIIRVDGVM